MKLQDKTDSSRRYMDDASPEVALARWVHWITSFAVESSCKLFTVRYGANHSVNTGKRIATHIVINTTCIQHYTQVKYGRLCPMGKPQFTQCSCQDSLSFIITIKATFGTVLSEILVIHGYTINFRNLILDSLQVIKKFSINLGNYTIR